MRIRLYVVSDVRIFVSPARGQSYLRSKCCVIVTGRSELEGDTEQRAERECLTPDRE